MSMVGQLAVSFPESTQKYSSSFAWATLNFKPVFLLRDARILWPRPWHSELAHALSTCSSVSLTCLVLFMLQTGSQISEAVTQTNSDRMIVCQPWQYTVHSSTDDPSANLVKTNRRTKRSLLTVMEYAANLERSPEEQFADTIFYTSIMAVGLVLTHLGVIKLIQKYTGTSLCSHSYFHS